MKNLVILLTAMIGLASCMTQPAIPPYEVSAVAWGNRGSMFGQGVTSVFPDNRVLITFTRQSGELRRVERQGPEGTFDDLLVAANLEFARLPERSSELACPDYGRSFVELTSATGAIGDRAEAQCAGTALDGALVRLGTLLSDRLDG